ncbi:MAG TPA: hypothetical protein VFJ05_00880 [Nitrososphaeraceae archaeon]|nr:hypothetical protein [Nitrososphaeraceae archaeon]
MQDTKRKASQSGIMLSGRLIEGQKHGMKRNPVSRAHGFRKFVTTNMVSAKKSRSKRDASGSLHRSE